MRLTRFTQCSFLGPCYIVLILKPVLILKTCSAGAHPIKRYTKAGAGGPKQEQEVYQNSTRNNGYSSTKCGVLKNTNMVVVVVVEEKGEERERGRRSAGGLV